MYVVKIAVAADSHCRIARTKANIAKNGAANRVQTFHDRVKGLYLHVTAYGWFSCAQSHISIYLSKSATRSLKQPAYNVFNAAFWLNLNAATVATVVDAAVVW